MTSGHLTNRHADELLGAVVERLLKALPSPLSVVQRPDAVTGPFAYVRLLGDREAVDALTPTLDHVVIDRGT
jgi:hypothetical protein